MAQMSSSAFLDTRNFDFALIRDMEFFRFANDRPSSFEPGELPGLTESWPVTDGAAYWAGNANVNLADVAIILGGDNLTLGSGNALTGGTISGMVLAEENPSGGAIFYIANTSISALTVQAAINTTTTADDMAVLRLMLVSDDLITGTNQNDYVEAWKGDDTLTGGNGRDTLAGESGKDSISGDAGNDSILGGNGSDTLSGGIGNDTVSGGSGSDRFLSDEGSDFLNAGEDTSRDIFIFTAVEHSQVGSYRDVIAGFSSGTDVLDLRQINANVFFGADQQFAFSATGPAANSVWLVTKSSGISVFADVSGNLTADFEILLKDITSLSASDILL